MEPNDFRDIIYSKDETGIVTLTLNTPARKNALSAVTFLEMFYAVDHFESIGAHPATLEPPQTIPGNERRRIPQDSYHLLSEEDLHDQYKDRKLL